jgi:hypothetical protein
VKSEGQYPDLPENPRGYCPDHSTGVSCPVGLGVSVGDESEAPIKFVQGSGSTSTTLIPRMV